MPALIAREEEPIPTGEGMHFHVCCEVIDQVRRDWHVANPRVGLRFLDAPFDAPPVALRLRVDDPHAYDAAADLDDLDGPRLQLPSPLNKLRLNPDIDARQRLRTRDELHWTQCV